MGIGVVEMHWIVWWVHNFENILKVTEPGAEETTHLEKYLLSKSEMPLSQAGARLSAFVTSTLEGEDRRIPETCWPAGLGD